MARDRSLVELQLGCINRLFGTDGKMCVVWAEGDGRRGKLGGYFDVEGQFSGVWSDFCCVN